MINNIEFKIKINQKLELVNFDGCKLKIPLYIYFFNYI
jgi:hypothetical protein